MARKKLPIGIDDFSEIRAKDYYFVDKSLMIRDFLEMGDKVALVARPRRFGKTLNMTMLREFLDITRDSSGLFQGLAIMDTEYADCINSRPVLYFTFKNCRARTAAELVETIRRGICGEYIRYEQAIRALEKEESYEARMLLETAEAVMTPMAPPIKVEAAIETLLRIVKRYYGRQHRLSVDGIDGQQPDPIQAEAAFIRPVLLIDEYDQPIMSSYEYGYHEELGTFFTNLYGMAMKGNDALDQALLTGVQRVVKESIFSQFNNPKVYTVFNRQYASSFGLTEEETGEPVQVWLTLDTSYAERDSDASLWGLFVNAGYLTVIKRMDADSAVVRIPNEEVMSEFRNLVSE